MFFVTMPAMARHDSRGRIDLDLPKAKLTRESLREAAMLFSYLRPYRGLVDRCLRRVDYYPAC